MTLQSKSYTPAEWNDKIIPLVEKGVLKDKSYLLEDSFLMFGQIFRGVLEDEDKLFYYCGWSLPKPEVIVKEYKL